MTVHKIEQALAQHFERHRVVFWYDPKEELREAYEAVHLPGVEKIAIQNNEFGVKYRVLHQEPRQQFLLYQPGSLPDDLNNWLLDMQLAYGAFSADQAALWLTDLGLGLEYIDVVRPYADFFASARRRAALKTRLNPRDTPDAIRLKMLAICAQADSRLDTVLENLLAELADGDDSRIRLIERCGLDDFLWQQAARSYGYRAETPTVPDFAISLFKACYALGLHQEAAMNYDAVVLLQRWKDNVHHQQAFDRLSRDYAGILSIEHDLNQRSYQEVIELDMYELIDLSIISGLASDVANRLITAAECERLIRQRRQTHWYATYQHLYEAILAAATFFERLDQADLTMESLSQGIERYQASWYQLDQLYRQFIYHMRASGQATPLGKLNDMVENQYSNQYLLKLNDNWQQVVDRADRWVAANVFPVQDFFTDKVEPFATKNKKVFVIISDGLRYEIGEELQRRIQQEDRYDAVLSPALTLLPSYTQLGMAALLPHKTLTIEPGANVLADDTSTVGLENRKAILDRALPGKATAIKADELLKMDRDESRALARDHNVVYVYHNVIDATGDKLVSEERVFDAVEETLEALMLIIKKLANANANNMLLTADHGFIYQNRALEESDFTGLKPEGDNITFLNRRFVLGYGLVEAASFKGFRADQLDLTGDTQVLLPRSINRIRVKGAGSRYVHGGAALQEIIVPLIQINKKRRSDTAEVEVNILQGASTHITTGQFSATFYQTEPVTEKVQPRTLRAGLYSKANELLSDQHDLVFDITSDNARDREITVRFILTSAAEAANGQEVQLRLEEPVPGTSHYRHYKTASYLLRRSFTSDFDF